MLNQSQKKVEPADRNQMQQKKVKVQKQETEQKSAEKEI